MKPARNGPCPCGSGLKYKKCCLGKTPWEQITASGSGELVYHLSARGKNLLFLGAIAKILQLDRAKGQKTWADLKNSINPKKVADLHQAVMEIWPDWNDLRRVLECESRHPTGLYVGHYKLGSIMKGVTRHCLYSHSILLVDPFTYPTSLRDEFNPVLHPEKFVADALKCLWLWMSLEPWVYAGIVKFIRLPGDFDSGIYWECIRAQEERWKESSELQKLVQEKADHPERVPPEFRDLEDYLRLCMPDQQIREVLAKADPDLKVQEIDAFLGYLQRKRDNHPYYIAPGSSQLMVERSGANYEMAKRTALISGSNLITDMPYRWKEIELDREKSGVDAGNWAPFIKAFHDLPLKYLDNVTLAAALTLRKEGRLESMRAFLRKLWLASESADGFSPENVENLAAELNDRVAEAEEEWKKIDRELIKWFGGEVAAGLMAGATIGTGSATWLAGSVAVAGATSIAASTLKRRSVERRFPAAFFLRCKER